MAALDKIFELLDVTPELTDSPDAIVLERLRGEIRFEDVSFRYRTEEGTKLALDDVSLAVPAGQTVALVGATGAGKSTFAKLVARFYDPTDGRVLVDGHDLRDVAARSLRSQMGIVPQEAFLFSGTIGDNIGFGRPDARGGRHRGRRPRGRRVGFHRGAAAGPRHRGRRARRAALRRPAPARRLRPRADRRPADPRARRGHLERRPAHRGAHRGRACGGCWPGARRSSSPTACRPSARPGGSSSSTRAGSSSRAATTSSSQPTARMRRSTPTGRRRRRRERVRPAGGHGRRRRGDGRGDRRGVRWISLVRARPAGCRRRPPRSSSGCRGCSATTTSGTTSPSARASSSATSASCPPTRTFAPVGDPRLAHFRQLFVARAHWGSGLATRLHAAAIDEARARGFASMRLFTPGGQARARRFYEREGWSLARPPAFDERIGLEIAEYRRAL